MSMLKQGDTDERLLGEILHKLLEEKDNTVPEGTYKV